MSDNFLDRIEKAFIDPNKVDGKDFLKVIRDLASKAGESTERITILLFALIAIFILIDQKQIFEVSFFGLKFIDTKPILILMPIIISYTYFDLIVNISKTDRLSKTYNAVMRKVYPSIYEEDLADYFIFTPSLFEYKYYEGCIPSVLWVLFFCIVVFSPVIFEVYALWRLLDLYRLEFPFIFSLICTLMFSVQGILTLLHLFRDVFKK